MDDRKVVRITPWIEDEEYKLFNQVIKNTGRTLLRFYVVTFKIKGHGNKHFTATIEADNEMVALNKFLNAEHNDPRMPLFKPKENDDE